MAGAVALATVTALLEEGVTKSFDRTTLLDIHRDIPSDLKGLMDAFSFIGNTGQAIGAGILAAVLLYWLLRNHVAALPVIAPGLASAADGIIKIIVRRPRPHLWSGAISPGSFSFPSGHATVSGALAGALTWIAVWHLRGIARLAVMLVALVFALGVGFSRLFLGAHWPTDVLGGYALGTAVLGLAAWGLTAARERLPKFPPELSAE